MRVSIVFLCLSLVLASCATTVSDKSPTVILKPEGENVRITLVGEQLYNGELLSVTAEMLYLRQTNLIYAIPLDQLQRVQVRGYDHFVTEEFAKELKPYCRYPQSLDADQWQAVLEYYQQEEILPPLS
jgi:hypothetical protein